MLPKREFWVICVSYTFALSCIWYSATAHMQRYSDTGEYGEPPKRYQNRRNEYNNQRLDATAVRERQNYNRMNTNFELGENQNQQQQQQQQRQSQETRNNRMGPIQANEKNNGDNNHKCRIWVPTEVVDKYELANTVQVDQNNQQSLILICCEGYAPTLWRGQTHCRPVCENCPNGICVAPGECQCHEEYVKNDNGDCVFSCPLGCLNGRCYLDGSCQCEPGYKLDETRKFCRPICSGGCGTNERHNCTEPEVCGCAKGYQLKDDGCQPVCQPDCGFGGVCRENNVCECGSTYRMKNGVCQSDCYQKCDNGICVSRNRCICNPGFTYHERSTQCIPV